jgi:molecular chaperone GrpE
VINIAKETAQEQENDDEKDVAEESESLDQEGESDKEDYAQLRENMLRIAAEFDNYKKRIKKELVGAENMGKALLIKNMLPIIDEFELALLAMSPTDTHISKGIEMVYSNLIDALKKEGLSEIKVDGVFDPYKHEIVMVRESDKKEGTILEVIKKGYMFEDKMLRPAAVIIAKQKDMEDKKNNDN